MTISITAYGIDNTLNGNNTLLITDEALCLEAYLNDVERPDMMRHVDITVEIKTLNVSVDFNSDEDKTANLSSEAKFAVLQIINTKMLPFYLNQLSNDKMIKNLEDDVIFTA